jgi:hypothetical protein
LNHVTVGCCMYTACGGGKAGNESLRYLGVCAPAVQTVELSVVWNWQSFQPSRHCATAAFQVRKDCFFGIKCVLISVTRKTEHAYVWVGLVTLENSVHNLVNLLWIIVKTLGSGIGCLFIYLNLNSVNQLIFVMVKCGVLFEVRTGFLNNILDKLRLQRVKLKQR